MRKVLFISQNMRGIKSINTRNCLAVCLKESWRNGNEILENGLITSGLPRSELNGNHGSQGVAMALSKEGVISWKAASSELLNEVSIKKMLVFFSCLHTLFLATHQMMFVIRVEYNMGALKHFAPWDIFCSGVIETFCPLGTYFGLGVLKYFASCGIETFWSQNL